MNTKLQELTDKIYLEGVEKGKEDAKAIVDQAKNEAAEILVKARLEASKILKIAEENAKITQKNIQSELHLFTRQSVNALKTEITDLVCGEIATDAVKAAVADKEFMQKMLLIMVNNWSVNQGIVIEAKDAETLKTYFQANAKALLNNGVQIVQSNNIKTDFTISPVGQSYKINFGEEEFIAYFKAFLRPVLIDYLF